MLLLLAVSTSVVLWMAQTVKVVPFIVQVDRQGYQVAVQAVAASDVTDDRVIMARIADFVTNTRSVYSDRTALVSLLMKSYDSIEAASPAQGKLDAYFRENNPLTRDNIGVSVTMQSVLRAAPESNVLWQAEWSEKTYEQGRFREERFYKGTFEVEFHSPTDIRDIMKNPLGIFVYDFHITEKLGN
jgi:type IV secretion system protein VirB5